MKLVHNAIRIIFKLLFGDFNGVQMFLYPLTLFVWIDDLSFSFVVTGLLTVYKHYFPLFIFLLVLLNVFFLILKSHSVYLYNYPDSSPQEKRHFRKAVIDIHLGLLFVVIGSGVLYMLAAFFNYYYHIRIPLKAIYPYSFRLISALMIILLACLHYLMLPHRKAGASITRSHRNLIVGIRRQPWSYLLYSVVLCVSAVLASFIFDYLVGQWIFPILLAFNLSPELIMLPVNGFPALLYDVAILGAAFMLSNLLFSPLALLIGNIADKLHPYNLKTHATQKSKT